MRREVYICDECKNEHQKIPDGWITLFLDETGLSITVPNVHFPHLGPGIKFYELPDELEFCSFLCFIKYFMKKLVP